ncbi:MAG: ADP-ribosylglycohydrolase family protein [Aggregatilineales bacterium]
MVIQRTAGCLFGMALGDSLGADTEFLSVDKIIKRFPPRGPQTLTGNPALVTDDTQMALAVGRALHKVKRPYTRASLFVPLRDEFVAWYNSPDNNRAPGTTCMSACENLDSGLPWYDSTLVSSKGCGANMRVAPVGVLPPDKDGLTESTRAAIAQFQAALTHGHPTALAAADLTSAAIADLMRGGDPGELLGRLRAYALSQRTVWHDDWLDPLLTRIPTRFGGSAQAFIAYGWDECLAILARLDVALVTPDRESDPCLATGLGWVAEEAFGTGLLCFLLYPDDPVAAIRRAVVTAGDSDSIACLTGAFAGACHGLDAWPADWIERIEYREDLAVLSAAWAQ